MYIKTLFASLAAGSLLIAFSAPAPMAQEAKPAPVEVKPAPAANTKTRRGEGEQMLGSFRDQARVSYAKTGVAPKTLTGKEDAGGCRVGKEELVGKYCKVHDKVYQVNDKPGSAALIVEDTEGGDGFAIMKFEWANGSSKISWYKTLEDLTKAHDDVAVTDKTTASGDGETAEAEEVDDPYALYKKEGRNWTHELTGGMTMKTTVKEVTKEGATLETQVFMKGEPLGDASTYEMEFTTAEGVEDSGVEPVKPIEKEIECKAGTFDCVSYDEGKTWLHKQYPGLIVKAQAMELVEFNENPTSDDGTEGGPDKPADDEGEAKPSDMSDYWERYVSTFKKGRTWTLKMAAGIQLKFEVTSVTETKAVVKTSTTMNGNAMGEPSDSEYDLVKPDNEGAEGDDGIKWVEKEIEVEAGKFLCASPDGRTWMMKKHPMIIVKSAGMELIEFTE
ncbi:MAG: hypothetical protein K8I27_05525 [Planctomycetes bacterium]|nr:hypothetical protein [Planctomycetota bacterium]